MRTTDLIHGVINALKFHADQMESARHEDDWEEILRLMSDAESIAKDGIYYVKLAIHEQEEYAKSVS